MLYALIGLTAMNLALFRWVAYLRGRLKRQVYLEKLPEKLIVHLDRSAIPGGVSFHLRFEGGSLRYTKITRRGRSERVVVPAPRAWDRFWHEAERSNVWRWNRVYHILQRGDPLLWQVQIRRRGQSVHAEGSGAFPADGDVWEQSGPAPSRTFKRFVAAVSRLAGGLEFE